MKKIFLTILLSFTLILKANMASPVSGGSFVGNPFLNKHVNVLEENILITLGNNFETAKFDIEYHIESEKDGIKIPFLFFAMQYNANFKISIDGKPIDLKEFRDFWDSVNIKENDLTNFEYLYTIDREEVSTANITFKHGKSETINIRDFFYFETNLSKGKHTINVSYNASPWQYDHSRIKELSYKYALSPAKYWKSFGALNIRIDASKLDQKITTNLGHLVNGHLETTAIYHFTEMPVDIISINLEPNLSKTAKFLLKVESFWLAIFFFFFIVLFHWYLMYKYRKRKPKSKFSFIALLGGILIPILFIFGLLFSSLIIDSVIGIYASGRASYGAVFSFFFLPKFLLIYLITVFIVDFVFKIRLKSQ